MLTKTVEIKEIMPKKYKENTGHLYGVYDIMHSSHEKNICSRLYKQEEMTKRSNNCKTVGIRTKNVSDIGKWYRRLYRANW